MSGSTCREFMKPMTIFRLGNLIFCKEEMIDDYKACKEEKKQIVSNEIFQIFAAAKSTKQTK